MFTTCSVVTLILTVVSMIKTFITHPGAVTSALINKLKHQLMQPKQITKLNKMNNEIQQRGYLLKCLNQAIGRHIQNGPYGNNFDSFDQEMELLDL